MSSSKKSKRRSRAVKSSLPVTQKVRARVGRSELLSQKPRESGSHSSTVTGTYRQECSADLLPLRMTLISLLGAKGYVKLITGERSLPFSPAFTYAFFSELNAIRKLVSSSSEDQPCNHGPQMDFSSMSKSFLKLFAKASKLSKCLSNAKSKGRCR